MSTDVRITATLKDAWVDTTSFAKPVIRGRCFGDIHQRFDDGEYIRSSSIVSTEGDLYHTLNSTYRVETYSTKHDIAHNPS